MAVAEEAGGVALLIDAKSEQANALRLIDAPLSLVLPVATVRDDFRREK
jgi:hypothetical protein